MKTEILPFTEEMLPAAGDLLARRHKRQHAASPLLPIRFEEPQVAAKAISNLWAKKIKHGYAAFRAGQMIAYLIGEQMTQDWGRCGYVYLPGYALAEGEPATVIQDLYACLGDDWVKQGVFEHGLYISAFDRDVIEALFDIGFGKERTDAILAMRNLNFPKIKETTSITLRKAVKGDTELLGDLSHVIANALADAPYWHPTAPEVYPELKEGWAELADDAEWSVWLALENDKVLGMAGFTEKKEEDDDLLAAPHTAYLSVAATLPSARGRGLSAALTWRGLKEAYEQGCESCYSNWISSNLLAARYWPRFGFKDVSYRLSKRVNPMIAWTRQGLLVTLPKDTGTK